MRLPPDARTPRAPFRAHRGVAGGCAPLECASTPGSPDPEVLLAGSDRRRTRPSASVRRSWGVPSSAGEGVPARARRTTRRWAPRRSPGRPRGRSFRLHGPAASGRAIRSAVTGAFGSSGRPLDRAHSVSHPLPGGSFLTVIPLPWPRGRDGRDPGGSSTSAGRGLPPPPTSRRGSADPIPSMDGPYGSRESV
jgi:hypothetical protein